MNIVIPMAGLGIRFANSGFNLPKPLIDINGDPMIIKAITSLGLSNAKYFFVIGKSKYSEKLKLEISSRVNCEFIEIDMITEGPACSVLLFVDSINNEDELIVANCDQIMEWDSEIFLMNARQFDGAVVTYHESTDKNSYAKINSKGQVLEIREKEVISNISLNGIHYWKQGSYFVQSAREMIRNDVRAPNGEFYVGPSFNFMIKSGYKVGCFHIPNQMHHAVGTPEDLKEFIRYENSKIE